MSDIKKNDIEPQKACKTTSALLLNVGNVRFEMPRSWTLKHAIDLDTKKRQMHTPFQCQATVGCLDFLKAGIVLEPESFVRVSHGLLAVTPMIRSMALCEEKPC